MAERHKRPSSENNEYFKGLLLHVSSDWFAPSQPRTERLVHWAPSYLCWKPGFWSGFGDALNVPGYFKPRYRFRNPRLADNQALYEDWAAVSADLERVLQSFEKAKGFPSQDRLFDPASLDKGA